MFSDDFVVGRFGADLLQDFLKFAFGISLGVVGVECVKLGCEELEESKKAAKSEAAKTVPGPFQAKARTTKTVPRTVPGRLFVPAEPEK